MIRQADIADIPAMGELAQEFYSSSAALRGNLDMAAFTTHWTQFINAGLGVIFLLEDDGIKGFLGGIKYLDINTGDLTATECFWYVGKARRGGGITLLRGFEEWAKGEGCKRVMMVHLMDSMPDKLKRLYESRGYTAAEVHYMKEI